MLKKLTESVAIFSVLIIVFGLVKQYLYYLRFGVPINYFLTISELGIIVSDDLIILCLFFGIIIFGLYLLIDTKVPIETVERENSEREQRLQNLKSTNFKAYRKIIRSKIILILALIIGSFILLITSREYGLKLISISVMVLMVPYFMLIFNPTLLFRHLSSSAAYAYATVMLFIIIYLSFIGIQVSNVENGKFVGTIIKTKDSTYLSTKERYFIGKTDKFVFFYDTKQKATTIIPSEKIESIILKQ